MPEKITGESFKPKALKEAEEYFKNVHMAQEQHVIFNDLVKIVLKYIHMDELAAKGIGWRSVSRWQLKHKRDLFGLVNETPEERIKSVDQLFEIVKEELIKILEDPSEKSLVNKAIGDMMEFYKKEYAYR
ncbi:MAG: hypothetical protein ACFFCV_03785 [Promethearchaeota archaeon]